MEPLFSVRHGAHSKTGFAEVDAGDLARLVAAEPVGAHEADKATRAGAALAILSQHGIVIPSVCESEAKRAGLPVALAAAILMRETSGGHNIFGHDPTVAVGWGAVTKQKYAAYRALRDRPRHGARCQGVGSCQLTYVGFQDLADRQGGCWVPKSNARVGFSTLAHNVRRSGLWNGVKAYNGTGPAATSYANAVVASYRWWRHILAGASLTEAADALERAGHPKTETLTL